MAYTDLGRWPIAETEQAAYSKHIGRWSWERRVPLRKLKPVDCHHGDDAGMENQR